MRRILAFTLFSLFFVSFKLLAQTPTPVGEWLTIDDETNTPRSIVQISDNNGELTGKLINIYFRPGEKDTDTCVKCTDSAHKDQRILGMTILWGMEQETADEWDGGYILDPKNGKIYHCKITISPKGNQLTVRGYIGIPWIGRSQNWTRVEP